jgi:hypothetical protein
MSFFCEPLTIFKSIRTVQADVQRSENNNEETKIL